MPGVRAPGHASGRRPATPVGRAAAGGVRDAEPALLSLRCAGCAAYDDPALRAEVPAAAGVVALGCRPEKTLIHTIASAVEARHGRRKGFRLRTQPFRQGNTPWAGSVMTKLMAAGWQAVSVCWISRRRRQH
jgi:hypothetical protein